MKKDFGKLWKNLKPSISTYADQTDFKKVYKKAKGHKTELHRLDSLIGSTDVESEFKSIICKYPNVLYAIPLLLARRSEKPIAIFDDYKNVEYDFKKSDLKFEKVNHFMRETGIYDLLESNQVRSLYDYVVGIEVGLDSHSRKNRGGKRMNRLVEDKIKDLGVDYKSQFNVKQIKDLFDIDLKGITEKKKFDFVFEYNNTLFLIKTNFYNVVGSTQGKTASRYKILNKELQTIRGTVFIWITDGKGWNGDKEGLKDAYDEIDHLYTLHDLENDVLKRVVV